VGLLRNVKNVKKEGVVYFRSHFHVFCERNEKEQITLKTVDTRSKLETVSP